jgi:hypothetical protein
MTLSLSPEQYERLFFQPSAGKGDLAKRLGMSSTHHFNVITDPRQETLHYWEYSPFSSHIRVSSSPC